MSAWTTMTSLPTTADGLNSSWLNNVASRNESSGDMFCSNLNQPTLVIFAQILYALVCVVGLLGNTLVIYVVLRFSKMQTVTNMYIVNLAVADECFLIGIPFLIATMSLELWPFGHVMCKIYMATTSINQFTSSIFLTIMSADRYVAVCHPISAPKVRTPFISKIVSLVAWTASAVLMVPVFMYAKLEILGDPEQSSCNIIWPESEKLTGQTAFTLYTFVLGFFIPLILIFCFYFLVIRKLQTVGPKNKSKEKKKSHRKVTKLVLTVITVYVLCWLPYWIMQVALIFTPPNQCQSRITVTVFLIAGCLSYSNSAMNPILYAFLSDNFKKSFMKACTCAAGTDVNATLHLENSVFPRRTQRGSERGTNRNVNRSNRAVDREVDAPDAQLVSRTDHSTTALTSRSNVTVTSDVTTPVKNGVKLNTTPTEL